MEKKWNPAICDNMDRPQRYYTNWNKLDEKRKILYDFTHMWNLRKQKNEQTKQIQKYREQRGKGLRGG